MSSQVPPPWTRKPPREQAGIALERPAVGVERIISGGQTGADRAGLEAGLTLGLQIGGHCPHGRRAEDGRVPRKYPLTPTASSDYRERTRRNVARSDATIVFSFGPPSSGSKFTLAEARHLAKPVLFVELDTLGAAERIRAFLGRTSTATRA